MLQRLGEGAMLHRQPPSKQLTLVDALQRFEKLVFNFFLTSSLFQLVYFILNFEFLFHQIFTRNFDTGLISKLFQVAACEKLFALLINNNLVHLYIC